MTKGGGNKTNFYNHKKLFAYIKMQETPAAEPIFYVLLRHTLTLFPYSVAISSPCRNNYDKNLAKFLESTQNPRTFAPVSYN